MTTLGQQDSNQPARPLVVRAIVIAWPSFFSACVSTMVFFAFVDPLSLRDITFPELTISREFGYTLGFMMFWLATAASSLFTWILVNRPGNNLPAQPPDR